MDAFDKLASDLKLSKTQVEAAQYTAEICRSELLAVQRAIRVCEGHEATISGLKSQLFTANEQIKKLNNDREKLDKKLQQISSLFGRDNI